MLSTRRVLAQCDIALLVDHESGRYAKGGRFVLNGPCMEARVVRALRALYPRVEVTPFSPDLTKTILQLRCLMPSVVVNVTEWANGDRKLDSAIAAVLDLLQLPYTGTGPDGLQLARDKVLSKQIVSGLGVAVPRHFVVTTGTEIPRDGLHFPMIVKPQFGDGSDEIVKRSLVRNVRELRMRVKAIRARLGQPAVCEQFIQGREIYVALLGATPHALPPIELMMSRRGGVAPQLATSRLKDDKQYRAKWGARYSLAKVSSAKLRELTDISQRIFTALKLRDYARLDFRLSADGEIYFLEANPNPDLDPRALGSRGWFAGIPFSTLVSTIVESARRRSHACVTSR
jgi:D-alanine-D-alanine ligase